jgi:hypothetical protein
MEDRPPQMQDPRMVGKLTIAEALEVKNHFEKQQAKQGRGDAVFGKDNKIPTKRFAAGEDNCCDILHEARWERLPVEELKNYWKNVPPKRIHTYRRLPLEHHGAAGAVSECVIVRAHDRTLPLKINMFYKANNNKKTTGSSETRDAAEGWENPKAVLDIMEALLNLAAVYYCLWHMDPTPQLLMRLLIHYNFGMGEERSEKDRCRLMVEVIDDILRANSCRAIGGDPPLSFRQCRERWKDAAEKRPEASGSRNSGDNRRETDRAGSYGNAGRDSRYKGRDSRGNNNSKSGGRSGTHVSRRVVLFNGNPVCFKYNRATGCDRPRKMGGCDDGKGGVFAHVCNFEDQNGKACLQQHCRENWRH